MRTQTHFQILVFSACTAKNDRENSLQLGQPRIDTLVLARAAFTWADPWGWVKQRARDSWDCEPWLT